MKWEKVLLIYFLPTLLLLLYSCCCCWSVMHWLNKAFTCLSFHNLNLFFFVCVLLISFESFGGKFSNRKLSKNITLIIAMFFEGLSNEQASTILFISPTDFLSALLDKVRNLSFTENHLFISFIYFFRILLPMLRCLCLNFVHGCYCVVTFTYDDASDILILHTFW